MEGKPAGSWGHKPMKRHAMHVTRRFRFSPKFFRNCRRAVNAHIQSHQDFSVNNSWSSGHRVYLKKTFASLPGFSTTRGKQDSTSRHLSD
jgi:hypothetical protein